LLSGGLILIGGRGCRIVSKIHFTDSLILPKSCLPLFADYDTLTVLDSPIVLKISYLHHSLRGVLLLLYCKHFLYPILILVDGALPKRSSFSRSDYWTIQIINNPNSSDDLSDSKSRDRRLESLSTKLDHEEYLKDPEDHDFTALDNSG
jgi:hypothetical protein